MMNPFSSRCCQHNHAAGWVYYAENSWMATPDNGLVAQLYTEGQVNATVGNGAKVTLTETTKYPFHDQVNFTVNTAKAVAFPLYLRIPAWCKGAAVSINGTPVKITDASGDYVRLAKTWKNGDKITLRLPMQITLREWVKNKNSVSVNYGPLTYSLKIDEKYIKGDSKKTAMGDSGWQEGADQEKWPSFEIHPASAWNYGLILDEKHPEKSFKVVQRAWPRDNNPFTNASAPIQLVAQGKKIDNWVLDQYGLCSVLPQSPVKTNEPVTQLTLVPMGGARLRISSFPVAE
jgi:hypothetical protein